VKAKHSEFERICVKMINLEMQKIDNAKPRRTENNRKRN
jgi:hypothetical protein